MRLSLTRSGTAGTDHEAPVQEHKLEVAGDWERRRWRTAPCCAEPTGQGAAGGGRGEASCAGTPVIGPCEAVARGAPPRSDAGRTVWACGAGAGDVASDSTRTASREENEIQKTQTLRGAGVVPVVRAIDEVWDGGRRHQTSLMPRRLSLFEGRFWPPPARCAAGSGWWAGASCRAGDEGDPGAAGPRVARPRRLCRILLVSYHHHPLLQFDLARRRTAPVQDPSDVEIFES